MSRVGRTSQRRRENGEQRNWQGLSEGIREGGREAGGSVNV